VTPAQVLGIVLVLALAASLGLNWQQKRAIHGLISEKASAEAGARQWTAAAGSCTESVDRLAVAGMKAEARARELARQASAKAAQREVTADRILTAQPAAGVDECTAAGMLFDGWLLDRNAKVAP
jgi:Mg2+/citrate symporter